MNSEIPLFERIRGYSTTLDRILSGVEIAHASLRRGSTAEIIDPNKKVVAVGKPFAYRGVHPSIVRNGKVSFPQSVGGSVRVPLRI